MCKAFLQRFAAAIHDVFILKNIALFECFTLEYSITSIPGI